MNANEDYKFRDDLVKDDKDTVPIEILTGPFKGVILRYKTVSIREQADNTAKLHFDYDILKTETFSEVSLRGNSKFEFQAGLILNTLILEATEAPIDGNREDDIEEPVEVGGLQSEGSAVS